ncbi:MULTISPECIES: two-partner secretion domain-containing protein [Nostocales]|uniref:Filamentous hemagglutinin N-terminal domain-containing protein n=5 Tax=Nostocales TaxID=1161 RepID=A0A8S9T2D7_9CYAN|nr:S-layer family protein [Tolypothrix bouteillei]KAF3885719.1 filamentous hemagglutinin N-terminal domain-containing protein [Tolypothrix bouteillei VB521301]
MTRKHGLHKCLQFGLAGLLGWLSMSLFTTKTLAQQSNIVPDNTLGAESSQVTGNFYPTPIEVITGGAIRQINLFHSFKEFNVSAGREVYFVSPSVDIQNILARVTGNNPSEIFGRLGTSGGSNPNLYLINPNGIVFGKDASLDVQGSFVGTTANGVQFGDRGVFSATNPEAAPLLTVNPSALLFNQNQGNARITNQSQASAGKNLIAEDVTGLRVPDGKSLLLVGGNINIDGGSIRSYGGNIELAGLAAPGNIGLNIAGDRISLAVPDGVERANVSLNNAAEVNVRGANGGNIKIHARDVNLAGESKLRAGIETGLGTPNSQGGHIEINATGTINLTDTSFISNTLRKDAIGKSGDINITTGSLSLSKNSFLDASTFGQGNSGKVSILAKDNILLTGSSEIYSSTEEGSFGNGGSINIQTSSLSLAQGSELNTKTLGQGNAGSININARDTISLDGFVETTLKDGEPSRIYSRIISAVNPEGTGKAGDIQIKTGSLQSTNGVFISSSTLGKGEAGNLTIDANNIAFDGGSSIDSRVFADGVGKGGNIWVNTGILSLLGGSKISTTVSGKGDAGNIFVNARDTIKLDGIGEFSIAGIQSGVIAGGVGNGGNIEITTGLLSLTNGASIDTGTNGKGNAGNISIDARENINLDGFGKVFTEQFGQVKLPSRISSDVSLDGVGKGGNIRINTRELFLNNKGQISADTFGIGDGGNIFIQVSGKISLSDTNNIGFTQISTTVSSKARGNGGTINIQSGNLLLDNASINSYTSGQGNAGTISIKVQDTLFLNNQAYFSSATSEIVGNGGDIDIQTGKLFLDNNSYFFASTSGKGNGGNISIQATDTVSLANNSNISSSISETGVGNAGNINIFAKSFFVSGESSIFNSNLGGKGNAGNILINTKENTSFTGGSSLSNGTSGEGNAGNIKIQASGAVILSGRSERLSSGISSGVLETGVGNSGDIEIFARSFELFDNANLATLSFGKGDAGNVLITTSGDTTIKDSSGIATFIGKEGNAGKIAIRAGGDVSISGTSSLSSILYLNAVGKGGDIEIQGRNFSLSDGAALLSATVGKGDAGNVLINATDDISFTNGSQVRADTLGQGNAGNVTLNAGGTVLFDGMSSGGRRSGIATQVTTEEGFTGKGEGGDININARTLLITNYGVLSSSSTGQGNAGDININTRTVSLDNEGIIAAQTNSGNGGNINLTSTDLLLLRRNSNISTTAGLTKAGGNGGNININAKFIVGVPQENSNISGDSFEGSGGNVRINSQGIFGIEARPKPTEKSDITASSELGISGVININAPDTSSIQNSFTDLSSNLIDTNTLLTKSCITRSIKRQENSFTIKGSGALPTNRPGVLVSTYATGEVRGVETTSRPWKKGDPIIEAQNVYRLNNGQLILSRECSS